MWPPPPIGRAPPPHPCRARRRAPFPAHRHCTSPCPLLHTRRAAEPGRRAFDGPESLLRCKQRAALPFLCRSCRADSERQSTPESFFHSLCPCHILDNVGINMPRTHTAYSCYSSRRGVVRAWTYDYCWLQLCRSSFSRWLSRLGQIKESSCFGRTALAFGCLLIALVEQLLYRLFHHLSSQPVWVKRSFVVSLIWILLGNRDVRYEDSAKFVSAIEWLGFQV